MNEGTEDSCLTPTDRAKIGKFIGHFAPRFFSPPDAHLYHYTTGENLIRIVRSKELWATQVSCLNDTKEVIYAVEQLHTRVLVRLSLECTIEVKKLLEKLDQILRSPGVEHSPVFVACFSDRRDDLSQWRAYSGGEGGYAIQFDATKLREYGLSNAPLVRVEYDEGIHNTFFDDIIKWSENFLLDLDGYKNSPSFDAWLDEFLRYWITQLSFFAPCIKHPKFKDENEYRIIRYLGEKDAAQLRFRQRQSMMARHFALDFQKLLPITGVIVGPCRYPQQSRIAVGDLLSQAGYDMGSMKIELTEVPYRSA